MIIIPGTVCNPLHVQSIYEWFDIGFDKFGRTPTRAQTEIGQVCVLLLALLLAQLPANTPLQSACWVLRLLLHGPPAEQRAAGAASLLKVQGLRPCAGHMSDSGLLLCCSSVQAPLHLGTLPNSPTHTIDRIISALLPLSCSCHCSPSSRRCRTGVAWWSKPWSSCSASRSANSWQTGEAAS